MTLRLGPLALALCAGSTFADTPRVNPGLWETTGQMELVGRPTPPQMAQPRTSTTCFTQEQIDKLNQPFPLPDRKDCKMDDYTAEGSHITFKLVCPSSTIAYDAIIDSPDAYHGTTDMTMAIGGMRATFTAKRISDECPSG
jgi:hypothetical protein